MCVLYLYSWIRLVDTFSFAKPYSLLSLLLLFVAAKLSLSLKRSSCCAHVFLCLCVCSTKINFQIDGLTDTMGGILNYDSGALTFTVFYMPILDNIWIRYILHISCWCYWNKRPFFLTKKKSNSGPNPAVRWSQPVETDVWTVSRSNWLLFSSKKLPTGKRWSKRLVRYSLCIARAWLTEFI